MAATKEGEHLALVQQVDELNLEHKYQEVYDLLAAAPQHLKDHPEILWRQARASYDIADTKPDDKKWKEKYYREAFSFSQTALEKDSTSFGPHKWFAVTLSALGDFVSTKEKIQNSFLIKEHSLKALEYKPKDPTTLHMLGRWCYAVANVGWIERKLAATLFASPPESSFAEAIGYFQKAHELHVWTGNIFWLGMAYESEGKHDSSKEIWQTALSIQPLSRREEEELKLIKKKLRL